MLDRRGLLALGLATAAASCASGADQDAAMTADGSAGASDQPAGPPPDPGAERLAYGEDPAQYADLYRPEGAPRGVVVVLHGGFWKAEYDEVLGRPLAASLADEGWVAWNLEYRRVGNGGGVPATLDDVAAGIDALADVPELDLTTVVTLGHSAGGHLATWAAARGRFEAWAAERVPVTAVVSQAGVVDLSAAYEQGLGGGAVQAFVGEPPGPAYDPVDPTRQIPLEVPVWCVHGSDDVVVPPSQSVDYVRRAQAAGATAEHVPVAGDHFVVIDPRSVAWATTLAVLDSLGPQGDA
jgi:acetyl esterase/lipase